MTKEPLPRLVEPRKLAVAEQSISACEPVTRFSRFSDMLRKDCGDVVASMQFGRDPQGLIVIEGELNASVWVSCQRCLQPMEYELNSQFHLAVIRDEEAARQLPRALEPLIVEDDQMDLHEVIEDELIISLPYACYHPEGECASEYVSSAESGEVDEQVEEKENPFKMLEALKSGKQSNEER